MEESFISIKNTCYNVVIVEHYYYFQYYYDFYFTDKEMLFKRLATFKGAKRSSFKLNPITLAKNGYIYNHELERVECFVCHTAFEVLKCKDCSNQETPIFELLIHQTAPTPVLKIEDIEERFKKCKQGVLYLSD